MSSDDTFINEEFRPTYIATLTELNLDWLISNVIVSSNLQRSL